LENAITELFVQGEVSVNEEILLTNINMAISSIEKAMESIDGSMPLDLVSIDITDAADYLGQITGESVKLEGIEYGIFSGTCRL